MINLGIAGTGGPLFAAWADSDEQLWYSTFDGSGWATPAQIPGDSSVGPSLAAGQSALYAAWKGSDGDQGLYYSSFDGSSWAPQTQIPGVGSSVGPSLAAFPGPLYAAWKGSGGDETLWYSSFDGSSWAPQAQIPGAASPVGPSLAAGQSTLYAAWAGTDSDEQLWYSSFDGSGWAPQAQIPGESSVGPSLAWFAPANADGLLYAAWKGSFGDQGLYYSSFDGSSWAPQTQISSVGSSVGPSLAVCQGLLYAVWQGIDGDQGLHYSSFDGSSWAPQAQIPGAQAQIPATVSAPAAGLGSDSNYILYSNCSPLINLSVTITVTEDLVWQSTSGTAPTENGFGFQLNAYSPTGSQCDWQQYIIALLGTELTGWADNWASSGQLLNQMVDLTPLPNVTIPAGYSLQISLANDNDGNVVAATYVVVDNLGNTQANVTQELLAIQGVTSADLAPITAFELDLVGPYNGESAVLSSGAGTITYEATSLLTVLNQEPSCTETPVITAETANSFYGLLPAASSNTFTQSFNVSTAAPMIRKQGKLRPSLIPPRA
jgi:hypothetical protein